MPQIFRASPKGVQVVRSVRERRSSPRSRGYDAAWDRRSAAYRQANPFCVLCDEQDRVVLADVVDHKYPVQDGGEVHCDDGGLWSLCTHHHGWKGRLEDYARRTGQLHLIVTWCDDPEARPKLRGDVDGSGAT